MTPPRRRSRWDWTTAGLACALAPFVIVAVLTVWLLIRG